MASTARKEPYEKPRPAKPVKHLTAAQKTKARAAAKKQGRSAPSLVDNMNAARKSGAKKSAAKKSAAKKSAAKKSAAKKSAAKRAPAKRSTAKKSAAKKSARTRSA